MPKDNGFSQQPPEPGTAAWRRWKKKRDAALGRYDDVERNVMALHSQGGPGVHSADPETHGSHRRISQDGL